VISFGDVSQPRLIEVETLQKRFYEPNFTVSTKAAVSLEWEFKFT
jgi:hypothetical protein